jgi:diguanylate cyclase (GGDEF)-like protein
VRTRVIPYLLLALAVASIGLAVWHASELQRETATENLAESRAAELMLTAMIDQETGLRGFALTSDEVFLQPLLAGRKAYGQAYRQVLAVTGDEADEVRDLSAQNRIAVRWQRQTDRIVAAIRRRGRGQVRVSRLLARKREMDAFRRANERLQSDFTLHRDDELRSAAGHAIATIGGLAALFGGAAWCLLAANRRAELRRLAAARRYRETQQEFAQAMLVAADEREARELLKSHLERSIEGSAVAVLDRDASEDRLEVTAEPDEASPLSGRAGVLKPTDCLAIRLGRAHEQADGSKPLLSCQICEGEAAITTCVPSLVGGQVVGSLLVRHPQPLTDVERERLSDSVAQAAPTLANLRTLALAEVRAATDALTGLPNARTLHESLRRMLAYAGRRLEPLTLVLLDLDHFKRVNDTFGHEAGDAVLAGVGDVLASKLRGSDFAARYGGEEFVVLLPATDRAGGVAVANNLRELLTELRVPGLDAPVTGSFGVASYPEDALDASALLRVADQALYAAKAAGRNCVRDAAADAAAA